MTVLWILLAILYVACWVYSGLATFRGGITGCFGSDSFPAPSSGRSGSERSRSAVRDLDVRADLESQLRLERWGPEASREEGHFRLRTLASTLGGDMNSTVKNKRAASRTTNDRQAAAKPDAKPNGKAATMPQSAAAPSPFTPIAEYGFLSDCHTGALIAPDGTIDWLCVPRFDSPSVFGALLDRGAGAFRLGPFGINVPSGRTYEPGTNTLITSWKTPSGWATTREALTMGPRRGEDTVTPHTRPPADEDAEHMLLRAVACIEGTVEIELVCEPASTTAVLPANGRFRRSPPRRSDGRRSEDNAPDRHAARDRGQSGAGSARAAGGARSCYCALCWDEAITPPANVEEANARLNATRSSGATGWARARIPDHELRPLVQRSALAIKGLTYMPTGATVAALTTSLPETPGGERNWDYRFTWIRDSTFTLQSLHFLDLDWEANEFMQFIADLERNDDGALQIMYGIDGRRDLPSPP